MTSALALADTALQSASWTQSTSTPGAPATYTFAYTTTTGATFTSVVATLPPGATGTPTLGPVTSTFSQLPANGTLTLDGNLLTYAFAPTYVNPGSVDTFEVDGLVNTTGAAPGTVELATIQASGPVDAGVGTVGSSLGATGGDQSPTTTTATTTAATTTTTTAATTTTTTTLSAVAPEAPTDVSAIAGSGAATVTFTPPADDNGSAVTGYTVTAFPGGKTATGSSAPITVTGLTDGVSYTFTVTATSAAGTSDPSAASDPVTPGSAVHHFGISNPSGIVLAGQPFTVTVTVTAYANSGGTLIADGFSGSVSLDDANGVVSTTVAVVNGVGVATLTILNPARADRLVITDASSHQAQTSAFKVVGPVTRYGFSGVPTGTVPVGQPFSFTVYAYDAVGDVATGFNGTAAMNDKAAALSNDTASFTRGTATYQTTVTQPEHGEQITVDDGTNPSFTNPPSFNVIGPVTHYGFSGVPTASVPVGQTLGFTVYAYDAVGDVATGFNGTAAMSDRAGALDTTTASFTHGIAAYQTTVTQPVRGEQITVSDGSDPAATTPATFNVVGPVDHYAVQISGTTLSVGQSFTVTVTAIDAAGNTATGFAGSLTLTDATGALTGPTLSFTRGTATGTFSVGAAIAADTISADAGAARGASTAFRVK